MPRPGAPHSLSAGIFLNIKAQVPSFELINHKLPSLIQDANQLTNNEHQKHKIHTRTQLVDVKASSQSHEGRNNPGSREPPAALRKTIICST
jgi:hypothetical protein